MTKSKALEALSDFVDKNCCWGKRPMKGMKIDHIEPTSAYTYLLTS